MAMRASIARLPWLIGLSLVLLAVALAASPAQAAPPVAPTLVGPSGVVEGSTLTFTWRASAAATFYYLQVNDATASPRFTAWYPTGQACPSASATCFVPVTMSWGTGAGTWWVQAWNPEGFAWSAGMSLTLRYTPPAWSYQVPAVADRFHLVLGGTAVLDRETGLVWQRIPSPSAYSWTSAVNVCQINSVGGAWGWRLPTLPELMSLGPLPAGHPFAPAAMGLYFWTLTAPAENASQAVAVSHDVGSVNFAYPLKSDSANYRRWCVRGGDLGNP
jgi:hypothetical protein